MNSEYERKKEYNRYYELKKSVYQDLFNIKKIIENQSKLLYYVIILDELFDEFNFNNFSFNKYITELIENKIIKIKFIKKIEKMISNGKKWLNTEDGEKWLNGIVDENDENYDDACYSLFKEQKENEPKFDESQNWNSEEKRIKKYNRYYELKKSIYPYLFNIKKIIKKENKSNLLYVIILDEILDEIDNLLYKIDKNLELDDFNESTVNYYTEIEDIKDNIKYIEKIYYMLKK